MVFSMPAGKGNGRALVLRRGGSIFTRRGDSEPLTVSQTQVLGQPSLSSRKRKFTPEEVLKVPHAEVSTERPSVGVVNGKKELGLSGGGMWHFRK